jgi:hypothetical protein
MEIIKWKDKITSYLGRNGTAKCIGLSLIEYDNVHDSGKVINITPINSRNDNGRCNIDIPKDHVIETALLLIKTAGLDLLELISDEQLPTLMGINDELDKIIADKLKEDIDESI